MRAAKVQASQRIRAVSPEPSLLAHTSSESRGTFRQKARSLAPLNGWVCAVKICHDGMLEDTNSLDRAQIMLNKCFIALTLLEVTVPLRLYNAVSIDRAFRSELVRSSQQFFFFFFFSFRYSFKMSYSKQSITTCII